MLSFGGAFAKPCCFYLFVFLLVFFVVVLTSNKLFKDKSKSAQLQNWLFSFWFGLLAAFVVVTVHFGLPYELGDRRDYWNYRGSRDWPTYFTYNHRRMPIEYPYEMIIDDKGGHILIWHYADDTWGGPEIKYRLLVENIATFHKHNNVVCGQTLGTNDNWFIFDCQIGKAELFKDKTQYLSAIQAYDFTEEPQYLTVIENWQKFWSNPSNWKGKSKTPEQM